MGAPMVNPRRTIQALREAADLLDRTPAILRSDAPIGYPVWSAQLREEADEMERRLAEVEEALGARSPDNEGCLCDEHPCDHTEPF